MEIAIAGMEDVGYTQAGFAAEATDFTHHLRKCGARDHAVLDDIVGGNAAHSGEGGFAAFPDQGAFGVTLRETNFGGAIFAAEFSDVLHEEFDFGDGAIEFDKEQAAAIGIVGVDSGFSGLDGEVVHHFHGGGEHAGGDDVTDGGARFVGTGKCGEERAHAFGALEDAKNNFGGDAESAFGTDEDAGEIVARDVQRFCAEVDERTVGENDFEAEYVRGGETIFEAVSAAGIFRDVAAYAADGLRRRIGGVEKIVRLDAGSDVEIDDTGFDDDAGVGDVNFEDAIHAGEADDDAVIDRERTAAEAGAGTASDERNVFAMAEAEDGLDLVAGGGEEDGGWEDAEVGEGVAFVGVEFFGRRDEGVRAEDGAELFEEVCLHGGLPSEKDLGSKRRLPDWRRKVKRGGGA